MHDARIQKLTLITKHVFPVTNTLNTVTNIRDFVSLRKSVANTIKTNINFHRMSSQKPTSIVYLINNFFVDLA